MCEWSIDNDNKQYKKHKMGGLLPPYQTNYSRETYAKGDVKVDWESFRHDSQ